MLATRWQAASWHLEQSATSTSDRVSESNTHILVLMQTNKKIAMAVFNVFIHLLDNSNLETQEGHLVVCNVLHFAA